MIFRTPRQTRSQAERVRKLILTPPKPVKASLFAQDHPSEIEEICIHCGLSPELLERFRAKVLQTHRRINAIVVSVPVRNKERMIEALRRRRFKVEEASRVFPMLHETVPSLQVSRFWSHNFEGRTVRCAILDTGIDSRHPDFAGRLKEYRNFSSEGNEDSIGHGTHVAGIVAGAGKVYRGVAPDVELVIGKVLGADGGDDTDVMAGLSWASRQNVDVINLSLGGPAGPEAPLTRECDALAKEGFLICAAAGNSGPAPSTIGSPGNASGVITVGAVDKKRRLAPYSSRGPVDGKRYTKPDLVCFGGGVDFQAACLYRTGITSTKSSSMLTTNCDQKRLYTRMSGTSMATPHVTGLTVLLLDILNKSTPEWTRKKKADFIKKVLRENTVPLEDSSLSRWDIGYGFFEPAQALEKILEFLAGGKRKRFDVAFD